jgi:hypothetical protein
MRNRAVRAPALYSPPASLKVQVPSHDGAHLWPLLENKENGCRSTYKDDKPEFSRMRGGHLTPRLRGGKVALPTANAGDCIHVARLPAAFSSSMRRSMRAAKAVMLLRSTR